VPLGAPAPLPVADEPPPRALAAPPPLAAPAPPLAAPAPPLAAPAPPLAAPVGASPNCADAEPSGVSTVAEPEIPLPFAVAFALPTGVWRLAEPVTPLAFAVAFAVKPPPENDAEMPSAPTETSRPLSPEPAMPPAPVDPLPPVEELAPLSAAVLEPLSAAVLEPPEAAPPLLPPPPPPLVVAPSAPFPLVRPPCPLGGCLCVGVATTGFTGAGGAVLMSTRVSLCQVCACPRQSVDVVDSNAAVIVPLMSTLLLASSLKSLHFQLMVSFASWITSFSVLTVRTLFAACSSM